jgi:5-methylcytosine-specific restriction protein B
MTIGIEGHTVSLTKNGYLKLIELIDKYPCNEILNHLDEIKLDHTQARKMLAGSNNNILPTVWDDIKTFDQEAKYALLLFSIIFSHKALIHRFKASTTCEMKGEIKRSELDDKVYTNLAFALDQAGLAINFANGSDKTTYDVSKIFQKNEIGPLAKTILKSHLINMGWSEPTATEPFQRTFEEQINVYEFHKVLGVTPAQFIGWLNGENISKSNTLQKLTSEEPFLSQSFLESINNANLKYDPILIHRFLGSLVTKPFLILTGLSGSGKTKLAQTFVRWICQEASQYRLIPVGADWTNREPLLGYPNSLKTDEYVKPDTGVIDLIIQANENPNFPHFLILDEMNLSHVERYFADFLSVMESKEEIPLYAEGNVKNGVPSKLKVPCNLFIIGTVNIDETTNMFSPKVLDRANTIEFRIAEEEMEIFLDNIKDINMDAVTGKGAAMAKSFLEIASSKDFANKDIIEINATLVKFFGELKKTGAEYGYRSASEILRLINQLSMSNNTFTTNQKIDIAIMQKLLPKLHGSRRKLCPVLEKLGSFCVIGDHKVIKDVFDNHDFDFNDVNVLYPLSLEKIARMYRGAIDNGFASFAEA